MHWYHPLGAWLEEHNVLPLQLFTKQLQLSALLNGISVMIRYRTHTLLLTTPELRYSELHRLAMVSEVY